MEQLNLKVKDKTLQFVIKHPCSESYWCELFLVDETNNIRLGADSLDIILSRLLIAFLPAKNRKFFEYQSQKMFSIINLMEPHFVIAGVERENLGLELILIDSNIGLNYMDEEFDEEILIENVRKISNDDYSETGVEYKVFDDELYLFPACDVKIGAYYNYNKVHLLPRIYKVKIIEEYILYNASFILYKFIKL